MAAQSRRSDAPHSGIGFEAMVAADVLAGPPTRIHEVTGTVGSFDQIGSGSLNAAAEPEPAHTHPAKQVAVLIYTSGTTGTPKGVMLTHENLLFSAKISGVLRDLTPEDRIYAIWLPGTSCTPDELESFVRPQLAGCKRPREIIVLESFPAGWTGNFSSIS